MCAETNSQTLLVLCPDSFGSLYQFEVPHFQLLHVSTSSGWHFFLEAMFPQGVAGEGKVPRGPQLMTDRYRILTAQLNCFRYSRVPH